MPQDNPFTALEANDKKAREKENKPVGQYSATCPGKTENIIVIGSENLYNSFWFKMMFIAPAFSVALGMKLPPSWSSADKTTILYVAEGYSHSELLTIEYLKDFGCGVIKISSAADFETAINTRTKEDGEEYKIKNLIFFAHGLHYKISLNYNGKTDSIDIDEKVVNSLSPDTFCPSIGRIYSYACRTGISVEDYKLGFSSLNSAKPENSLAQKMANRFDVKVHAFYKRTYFRYTLRNPSKSAEIADTLKRVRDGFEGRVIQIPPNHEALPHDGLADNGWDLPGTWFDKGPRAEGTHNYALWRKSGARALPIVAESPAGLPDIMNIFDPE